MTVSFSQVNRVDIRATENTVSAWIGDLEVLSKHRGRPWQVGEDVTDLGDVVTAAVTLMDWARERGRQP